MSPVTLRRRGVVAVAITVLLSSCMLGLVSSPASAADGPGLSFTPDQIAPGESTSWIATPAGSVQAYYLDGELIECFFQLGDTAEVLSFETITSGMWFGADWSTFDVVFYSVDDFPLDINGYVIGPCPASPSSELAIASATLTLVPGDDGAEPDGGEPDGAESPDASDDELAQTGTNPAPALSAAMLALLLGAGLLVAVRARRA